MSREKRSAQVYQWGATVKGGWNFMNRAKEVRLLALKRATGLCIDGRRGGGGGAGTSHVTLWTWSNFASDAGACSSSPPYLTPDCPQSAVSWVRSSKVV